MSDTRAVRDVRSDLLAARATGVGIGLIVLMVSWLVANRVFTIAWGVPVGPMVAFGLAIVVGLVTSVIAARALVARST